MYQLSDSDSIDSDEGIRYKTESIRNKKPSGREDRKDRESASRRRRSRSRSRSQHGSEKKKLKKKDHSPNRKHKSKNRENKESDDRKHKKEKEESKKLEEKHRMAHRGDNNKSVDDVECLEFGPSLPHKDSNSIQEESRVVQPEETSNNSQKSSESFGPALPPMKMNDEDFERSDNAFGPQLPSHLTKKLNEQENIIGPALPAHFITVSSLEDDSSIDLESSNLEENKASIIGPALLPQLLERNEEQPTENIIGPSVPPHLRQQLEHSSNVPEEVEEDEDVYGPLPVGAQYSQAHIELEERALKIKMDQLGPSHDKQPVREEWMLTLPEAKATHFGLGPRQFRTKAGPDLSDRSVWTETPEDKAKKKEGKMDPPVVDLKKEAERKHIEERNKEQEAIAKKHKKEKDSLLDMHMKKLKKEKKKEGGPSERRPFSREIDLQVNRFDEAQKKAVLKKAQLLDTRFAAGESKFL